MAFYDKTIGYSPLEDVDLGKLRHVVEVNARIIDQYFAPGPGSLILVAGAGRGDEAEIIHQQYGLRTIGIDISLDGQKSLESAPHVALQRQDLLHLAFRDRSFDLIYSYHVLEHVQDPDQALREMQRVLRPGGILFIGFPNKHRLFSYLGASQRASLFDKLKWNLNDYAFRLRGKFENRHGAHAGFTETEFSNLASGIFSRVRPVRNRYMQFKYSRFAWLIRTMIAVGAGEFVFPSNYFICEGRGND